MNNYVLTYDWSIKCHSTMRMPSLYVPVATETMNESSTTLSLYRDLGGYILTTQHDPSVGNVSAPFIASTSGKSGSSLDTVKLFEPENSTEFHLCYECGIFVNSTNVSGNGSISLVGSIPYTFSVVLIGLYTFTTLAAVLGNSLAIVVFAKGKRSNTDLRAFLINLAVADLIMAIVCIPFTFAYQITEDWMFPDVMCPIVQCCQQVSVLASVCTNTAIGIDRLIAVKFPLRKRVTNSRSKLVILSIWVLAWSLGVIPLVKVRTVPDNGKLKCEEDWTHEQSRLAFGFSIMIITYFLPLTILSVTYASIGRQLWKHKLPGNADDHRDAVQLKSKRKVVKMLVTIVLLFGLCWLPLHIFIIIITFNFHFFGHAANSIYFGVHWLSMANSFVNPLIYGFMNESFRADLKSMAHSCLRRRWGHRRLNHRAAALRWKLGDCNVHDARMPPTRGYRNKPLRGSELRDGRQNWRNGHARSAAPLDVASLCSCDLNSISAFDSMDYDLRLGGPSVVEGKGVYISGKRRTFTLRELEPGNSNKELNGMKPNGKGESPRRNAKLKCSYDANPGLLYDGSDVILLKETKRKENG